jgi:hypothetical protein
MPVGDGSEPVADDELLYRRIPVSQGWYKEGRLSPEAFDPREGELTGISVYRDKYKSLQEVAKGKSRRGYYVAVLRAGDLRERGIEVVQRPKPDDPGHAELPDLTCHNRLTTETLERKHHLTELCLRVEGPFPPTTNCSRQ